MWFLLCFPERVRVLHDAAMGTMIQAEDMPDFMDRFFFFEVCGGESVEGEDGAVEMGRESEDEVHPVGVQVLGDDP